MSKRNLRNPYGYSDRHTSKERFLDFADSKGIYHTDDARYPEDASDVWHRLKMFKLLQHLEDEAPQLFVEEVIYSHMNLLASLYYPITDDYEVSLEGILTKILNNFPLYAKPAKREKFLRAISAYAYDFKFSEEVNSRILDFLLDYKDNPWAQEDVFSALHRPIDNPTMEKLLSRPRPRLGINVVAPCFPSAFLRNYQREAVRNDPLAVLFSPISTKAEVREAYKQRDGRIFFGHQSASKYIQLSEERYHLLYKMHTDRVVGEASAEKDEWYFIASPVVEFLLANDYTPREILQSIYNNNPAWRNRRYVSHPEVNRSNWSHMSELDAFLMIECLDDPTLIKELAEMFWKADGLCAEVLRNVHSPESLILKALKEDSRQLRNVEIQNTNLSPLLRVYLEYKSLFSAYDATEKAKFETKAKLIAETHFKDSVAEVPLSYVMNIIALHFEFS